MGLNVGLSFLYFLNQTVILTSDILEGFALKRVPRWAVLEHQKSSSRLYESPLQLKKKHTLSSK